MNRCAVLLFSIVLAVASCDDVLEKNIEKKKITLRAPQDSDTTSVTDVSFWWDDLEGAQEYELLIASPVMAAPNALVMDTTISKNKMTVSLLPGNYEWCVKGVNSAYETEYSCRLLVITN